MPANICHSDLHIDSSVSFLSCIHHSAYPIGLFHTEYSPDFGADLLEIDYESPPRLSLQKGNGMSLWNRALVALGVLCAIVLSMPSQSGAGESLLLNGDFELPFATIRDMTETWTIWGKKDEKSWGNFTRETENAHSGNACLKVVRPANPDRWFNILVTNPRTNAILPGKNKKYTIRFCARTDKPGISTLMLAAYLSVDPFVDGPQVAKFNFQTKTDWQEYSFHVTEGKDFFAEATRHIYAGFFLAATPEQRSQPMTFWLDDFSVQEEDSAEPPTNLLNPATMPATKVPESLTRCERLDLRVQTDKRVRPTNKLVGGVSVLSLNRWLNTPFNAAGDYTLAPALEARTKELHLPLTRFYDLLSNDCAKTPEQAVDLVARYLEKTGIPQETTVIELEDVYAQKQASVEEWQAAVRHSQSKGYRFRYWEIGNEVFLAATNQAFPTPDDYVRHVIAVSQAIKAMQPEARIGLSCWAGNHLWGNYILKQAAGHYDFLCPHLYGALGTDLASKRFEAVVIGDNHDQMQKAQQLNALLKAYNPGRDVFIYDTEWGLHGGNADFEVRNSNIQGTVYRAVRLLYYAREELVRGASSWVLYSNPRRPGFGVLYKEAPEKTSMLFWLYSLFNQQLGDWVVEVQGSGPYYREGAGAPGYPLTPTLASVSEDGKQLSLMLVNGSWENEYSATIGLPDFQATDVQGVYLASDDLKAQPVISDKEDFVKPLTVEQAARGIQFTLPAHSVVFLQLHR